LDGCRQAASNYMLATLGSIADAEILEYYAFHDGWVIGDGYF
jgi:hypothetical protein